MLACRWGLPQRGYRHYWWEVDRRLSGEPTQEADGR
jgi:hypothetical protein